MKIYYDNQYQLKSKNVLYNKIGFTLIELIVSMFIIGIGFFAFNVYYKNKTIENNFKAIIESLVTDINRASINSSAHFKDHGWTIFFENNKYVFHQGVKYNGLDGDTKQVLLNNIEIADPYVFNNGNGDKTNKVFFENGTGETLNTGTIILNTTQGNFKASIRINANGSVNVEFN